LSMDSLKSPGMMASNFFFFFWDLDFVSKHGWNRVSLNFKKIFLLFFFMFSDRFDMLILKIIF
jgi:hypothetical protein